MVHQLSADISDSARDRTRVSGKRFSWKDAGPPLSLLLVVLAVVVLLAMKDTSKNGPGGAHFDMVEFHLPQINILLHAPLTLFPSEYTIAMTPGYHFVLASVLKLLGYQSASADNAPLRVLNILFGMLPVAVVMLGVWRRTASTLCAAALAAPLAGSTYVLGPAAFITTDGIGAGCFAVLILLLCLYPRSRWMLAVFFLLTLACRQIYLPVAAVIGLSVLREPLAERRLDMSKLVEAGLVLAPGLLLFAAYVVAWGGFVPAAFRQANAFGPRPAVLLHAFAITGFLSISFMPFCRDVLSAMNRRAWLFLGMVAPFLAVLWMFGPVSADIVADVSHLGSIVWTLAVHTPGIAGHAFIVLALALLGALVLTAMAAHAWKERYFPAELLAIVFYFVGYSLQIYPWARYIEPPLLICFAFFAARFVRKPDWTLAVPVAWGLLTATALIAKSVGIYAPWKL